MSEKPGKCLGTAPEHLRALGWYLKHQAYLRNLNRVHHDPEGAKAHPANQAGMRGLGIDLHDAILRNATFSHADLRDAIFSDADLTRVNFEKADLSYSRFGCANLSFANLREADFTRANLSEVNFLNVQLLFTVFSRADLLDAKFLARLPMSDPRGYEAIVAYEYDTFLIYAGCRKYTLEAARQHWGTFYTGRRDIGDMYLEALDWLESNRIDLLKAWGGLKEGDR